MNTALISTVQVLNFSYSSYLANTMEEDEEETNMRSSPGLWERAGGNISHDS